MEENKDELQLIVSPIDKINEITVNYEQLKTALGQRLENYKNMTYSENEIDIAKKDRANLNKLDSAIKGKITEIRKELLDPFTVAEKELKELSSMVKETSILIDNQVKSFESKEQEEKRELIKKVFDAYVGDLKDLILFDIIFNPRWLNKTYTMKKIEADINHLIVKAHDDMAVIDGQMKDENVNKTVKAYYFSHIVDPSALGDSLTYGNNMMETNKKLDEISKQEIHKDVETKEVKETEEELQVVDFRVWVTQEQKMKIREFLIQNNIKYGGVV